MASANVVNVSVNKATRAQRVTVQNPMRLARQMGVFVLTVVNVNVTGVYVREDTRGPTAKHVLLVNVRVNSQGKKTCVTLTFTKPPYKYTNYYLKY